MSATMAARGGANRSVTQRDVDGTRSSYEAPVAATRSGDDRASKRSSKGTVVPADLAVTAPGLMQFQEAALDKHTQAMAARKPSFTQRFAGFLRRSPSNQAGSSNNTFVDDGADAEVPTLSRSTSFLAKLGLLKGRSPSNSGGNKPTSMLPWGHDTSGGSFSAEVRPPGHGPASHGRRQRTAGRPDDNDDDIAQNGTALQVFAESADKGTAGAASKPHGSARVGGVTKAGRAYNDDSYDDPNSPSYQHSQNSDDGRAARGVAATAKHSPGMAKGSKVGTRGAEPHAASSTSAASSGNSSSGSSLASFAAAARDTEAKKKTGGGLFGWNRSTAVNDKPASNAARDNSSRARDSDSAGRSKAQSTSGGANTGSSTVVGNGKRDGVISAGRRAGTSTPANVAALASASAGSHHPSLHGGRGSVDHGTAAAGSRGARVGGDHDDGSDGDDDSGTELATVSAAAARPISGTSSHSNTGSTAQSGVRPSNSALAAAKAQADRARENAASLERELVLQQERSRVAQQRAAEAERGEIGHGGRDGAEVCGAL